MPSEDKQFEVYKQAARAAAIGARAYTPITKT